MPQMTNQQKIDFLIHVYNQVFFVARFPFKMKPSQTALVNGKQLTYSEMVALYQERAKTITIGEEWAPWVIGGQISARTFKSAERGANILLGFDIDLDIGLAEPYKIRVVEQNPFKKKNGVLKETAIMAQRGVKICWVFKRNVKDGFLGKVQDGVWEQSQPRAYTKKSFTPLKDIGAGIYKTDRVDDQYGVSHHNLDGDWMDDLDVIGGEDDVIGCI